MPKVQLCLVPAIGSGRAGGDKGSSRSHLRRQAQQVHSGLSSWSDGSVVPAGDDVDHGFRACSHVLLEVVAVFRLGIDAP